jgi:Tfp pilus assembly protein PilO
VRGGRLMRVMFTLTLAIIVLGLAWFFALGWSHL